jgi:hypothetical protein
VYYPVRGKHGFRIFEEKVLRIIWVCDGGQELVDEEKFIRYLLLLPPTRVTK